MGLIKTTEQNNGSYLLEITYGGAEAPFGGIDTSAPPAYIDPKCFATSDGFIVVDNKLVAVSLVQIQNPVIWGGTPGVTLLAAGTFYNSIYKQLNFAFGCIATPFGTVGTTPTGVSYKFFMTSWDPSDPTVVNDDTLSITLFDSASQQVAASITLDVINSNQLPGSDGTGGAITITAVSGSGGLINGGFTLSGGTGYTIGTLLQVVQGSTMGGFIVVSAIGGGGSLSAGSVDNPGNLYTTGAAPLVTIASSNLFLVLSQSTLTSSITAETGGVATALSIAGGFGFTAGQSVPFFQASTFPNSSAGSITINTVDSNGAILSFTLSSGGTGMVVGPVIIGYIAGVPSFVSSDYQTIIAAMVTDINLVPWPVIASASNDGLQLILTAPQSEGAQGNDWMVQDLSYNQNPVLAPPFYFTARSPRNFEGGMDSAPILVPRSLGPSSIAQVGGTIYIVNLGPFMLQYSGPGTFTTLTMYTGVNVLRKFAGALVGLGVVPQVGVFTQDTDMIFVWSASEELSEWSPVTVNGDVTGAGFAQIADISDALTGAIVANNTIFIIRQQGITYATPTDNGTDPYSFAHISLGDSGEGGQVPALICQYDQMGVYVGNSNIFGIAQSATPIGEKIKSAILTFLNDLPDPIPTGTAQQAALLMSSAATGIFAAETSDVLFAFMLGQTIYIYNATNQVWMQITYQVPAAPLELTQGILCTLANSSMKNPNQSFKQNLLTLAEGLFSTGTTDYVSPVFYSLQEGVNVSIISNPPSVTFPVEEVMFARDINIDAIVIGLYRPLIPTLGKFITLTFAFNGNVFGTLELGQNISFQESPEEFQVYPAANGSGIAANFSAPDPQLTISISTNSTDLVFLRITKVAIFGSFDPNQRPV